MTMQVAGLISGIVGTVVSLLTLAFLIIRGIFSVEKRLTKMETKMEPFWEGLTSMVADALQGIRPRGNPITPERWDYLLQQMKNNRLTPAEALELNNAMIEQQDEARRQNDNAKLVIIGIGLAILAAIILGGRRD